MEIKTQRATITTLLNDIETKFNELTKKYETEATKKIDIIETKIEQSNNLLNQEKKEFDDFITKNTKNYEQKYNELNTIITKYNTSTTSSLTEIEKKEKSIITSHVNIEQIEAYLKKLKENISEYINEMTNKTQEIDEKTKQFNNDTQEIINKNKEQTKEIDKQLRLATGRSLFHSFHKRKKDLENNQWIWLAILGLSIISLIAFSCWMIKELSTINWQNIDWTITILLKILLPLPLIYLVAFVTDRYTKERRLLEEYAFKSTISLALKPYFDMVTNANIN